MSSGLWVLPVYLYESQEALRAELEERVIPLAEAKVKEQTPPQAWASK